MRGTDGKPKVCEKVWISYYTADRKTGGDGEGFGKLTAGYGARDFPNVDHGRIGPEFTFGIYASKATEAPVLIIKTAWGGKSLNTDFRPPSTGPYVLPKATRESWAKHPQGAHGIPKAEDRKKWQAEKAAKTGVYYRLMMEHAKELSMNSIADRTQAVSSKQLAVDDRANGGTVAPRHVPFDGAQGKQAAPGCRTPNYSNGQTVVVAIVAFRLRSGQAMAVNMSVLSVFSVVEEKPLSSPSPFTWLLGVPCWLPALRSEASLREVVLIRFTPGFSLSDPPHRIQSLRKPRDGRGERSRCSQHSCEMTHVKRIGCGYRRYQAGRNRRIPE